MRKGLDSLEITEFTWDERGCLTAIRTKFSEIIQLFGLTRQTAPFDPAANEKSPAI